MRDHISKGGEESLLDDEGGESINLPTYARISWPAIAIDAVRAEELGTSSDKIGHCYESTGGRRMPLPRVATVTKQYRKQNNNHGGE